MFKYITRLVAKKKDLSRTYWSFLLNCIIIVTFTHHPAAFSYCITAITVHKIVMHNYHAHIGQNLLYTDTLCQGLPKACTKKFNGDHQNSWVPLDYYTTGSAQNPSRERKQKHGCRAGIHLWLKKAPSKHLLGLQKRGHKVVSCQ